MICLSYTSQDLVDHFPEQRNPFSFNLTQQEIYSISLISFVVLFLPIFLCPMTAWPAEAITKMQLHECLHTAVLTFVLSLSQRE